MPECMHKKITLAMLLICMTFPVPIHAEAVPSAESLQSQKTIEAPGPKSPSGVLDIKPPVSRIEIGLPRHSVENGKTYITAATDLSIIAVDHGSGVSRTEYRIDGGAWSYYREPFKIDDEGEHRIEFRSVDNAENIEEVRRILLTCDSTPPISTFIPKERAVDSSDICYINAPLNVTLTAFDRFSGVKGSEYRIDQGEWRKYSPFIIDDIKNHLVSYRSSDNLGNLEIARTVGVHIDKTPPVTTISAGDPHLDTQKGVQTVHDSTFFTLSGRDTQSGVSYSEYRIDDGEWVRYEPFTIQEGGKHSIEYRSIDKAGNKESIRSLSVMVDTFPPITVASIDNKPLEPGSARISAKPLLITLSANDKHSGIKKTEYKLDGGPWRPYQPFSITDQGMHLVEFRSVDQLDNVEPTRFIKVTIDTTPPVTSLLIGDPKEEQQGVFSITDRTVLSLSAVDELSGTASSRYLISGRGERQGTEPFTIATAGEYEIRYWSTDRIGNREPEKTARVKVVIPPQQTVITQPEKSTPVPGQRTGDSDIPDSIRLPSKPPVQAQQPDLPENKVSPVDSIRIGDETSLELDRFIAGKPTKSVGSAYETHTIPAKEYFGVGGINALIIAIIFLVL